MGLCLMLLCDFVCVHLLDFGGYYVKFLFCDCVCVVGSCPSSCLFCFVYCGFCMGLCLMLLSTLLCLSA